MFPNPTLSIAKRSLLLSNYCIQMEDSMLR